MRLLPPRRMTAPRTGGGDLQVTEKGVYTAGLGGCWGFYEATRRHVLQSHPEEETNTFLGGGQVSRMREAATQTSHPDREHPIQTSCPDRDHPAWPVNHSNSTWPRNGFRARTQMSSVVGLPPPWPPNTHSACDAHTGRGDPDSERQPKLPTANCQPDLVTAKRQPHFHSSCGPLCLLPFINSQASLS